MALCKLRKQIGRASHSDNIDINDIDDIGVEIRLNRSDVTEFFLVCVCPPPPRHPLDMAEITFLKPPLMMLLNTDTNSHTATQIQHHFAKVMPSYTLRVYARNFCVSGSLARNG